MFGLLVSDVCLDRFVSFCVATYVCFVIMLDYCLVGLVCALFGFVELWWIVCVLVGFLICLCCFKLFIIVT